MKLASSILVVAFFVVVTTTAPALAARCTGSASCRACSNCSSCGHCKAGGSCGVCSSRRTAPAPPPARPARTYVPPTPAPAAPARPVAPPAPAPVEVPETPQPELLMPAVPPAKGAAASERGVSVWFSPRGGCTKAIVDRINGATASVKVQAYRLTSPDIARALLAAHNRGVSVLVLLDSAQQSSKYSDATFFHNMGVPVLMDGSHAIAHDKVVIVDERTVITGSFNFSAQAEASNGENLLVIEGHPAIAKAYVDNFEEHRQHCRPYLAPAGDAPGASAATTRPAAAR